MNEHVLVSMNTRLEVAIEQRDINQIADIVGFYLKNKGAVVSYNELDVSLYIFWKSKNAFLLDVNKNDDEALTRLEPIFERLDDYFW